ncbi:MAG: amino acid adenylation domain-containing protein [bacterium]|nr:amino acid adenylation domain-containing protein [bacterium]
MSSKNDYEKLIYQWNETESLIPDDKTIVDIFEETVIKHSDNIAIIFNEDKFTYKELNEKANQLAHTLRHEYKEHWGKNIVSDTMVGVYLESGIDMIVSILGILKSGAVYVPFDKKDPGLRLKYKVNDCGCKMILTNSENKEELVFLPKKDTLPVSVDDYSYEINKAPKTNPKHINKATDLAYVIYTSGSTGNPKGVLIENRSVVNLYCYAKDRFKLSPEDTFGKFAGVGFDASVIEVFPTLLSGATLNIIPEKVKLDPNALNQFYEDNKITIAFLPTQLAELFMELENSCLRLLVIGGDKLKRFIKKNYIILNAYGPSEATVHSSDYKIDKYYKNIPIGKPIYNCKIFIINENMQLCPVGVQGELCISGIGLARGYLNKQDLTLSKFIKNPLIKGDKNNHYDRLYRTGDLARWLPDGNIEFIGRNDNQVKIRGHRIELGEIETILSNYPSINQCVAKLYEKNHNKFICAYYLSDKEENKDKIKNFIAKYLPNYMIPSYLVKVESIPVNNNGKIEKDLLPDPKMTVVNPVAPKNEFELKQCEIWKDILGLENIGIQDDFFEIGGNSMLAIKLIEKLKNDLNIDLKISQLHANSSIKALNDNLNFSNKYQPIISMGSLNENLPNMYMIHPANGGCEVYSKLALSLKNSFNCYGIDNYNLYHDKKISNINDLAKYYLEYIKNKENSDIYYLSGWSLGGLIALEIASILEGLKKVKIKVVLFDTFLMDNKLRSIFNNIDQVENYEENLEYFSSSGLNNGYGKLIMDNYSNDMSLSSQRMTNFLIHSKILLCKSNLIDNVTKTEIPVYSYAVNLPKNNIDKVCSDMKVVRLDCHHNNILDKYGKGKDKLVKSIIKFK